MEAMILNICLKMFTTKDDQIVCAQAMVNCVYKQEYPTELDVVSCKNKLNLLMEQIRIKMLDILED